ncbi:hypothetical protein JCM3765_007843 [Sporobolomyces pararoseus]
MSATAPGSASSPSSPLISNSIKTPITRSGSEEARGREGEVEESVNLDKSSTGNGAGGVNELLQKALSLHEVEEIKDGEKTPGSHSRASTDLTAVERLRISPADSSTSPQLREEDSNAPPARPLNSRQNSFASSHAEPPRLRHSNSRRPSNRPYPPTHYHPHQSAQPQRISPPQGWHGPSPTSSNDGSNYNHGMASGHQVFYPPLQGNGSNVTIERGGGAGSVYGYSTTTTTTPPFLAHIPRHPSQISQISDQSAGYSTGSPYSSSSSSLWYQHYASTVTTPSSYPAALEGGLVFPSDTSPEPTSEGGLSAQQCPTAPVYSQYEPGIPTYPQPPEFIEVPASSSSVGPYQTVYFAPTTQRVIYTPSQLNANQAHAEVYSTAHPPPPISAAASRHDSQTAQIAYPITSARPHVMPHPEEASYQPHPSQNQQPWRGGRHSQPVVPTAQHQQYSSPYHLYSAPLHYPNVVVDQRRYSPYQASIPVHYPPHLSTTNARPYIAPVSATPPVIPPRPSISSQFSPRAMAPPPFSPSPSSPPKIYSPPVEIARGVLASTRLREAAQPSGSTKPVRATRNEGAVRTGVGSKKGNLPKPPAHSPHALWVGNVPSDASHSELWQFFVTRPPPSAVGLLSKEDIDLDSPGVESIHLIARSNCAFVNYISNLHLQHAISISNGLSLRPNDARCKALLCRVRKEEDESKTGVGAQRVGGIHKAFVKLQRERMNESEQILRHKIQEEGAEPKSAATKAFEERRQSSSGASVGTTSTTSSFLTKHFEKRWFIMKSHDEADLKLSVESGLWATQPHNEPVLQQAFRTAKDVFLVFSANGSGEWFGYARMSGPISSVTSSKGSRPSWGSSGQASIESVSSASLSAPSQTIQEDTSEPTSFPPRAPVLFSPSENRLTQASPSLITPTTAPASRQLHLEQRHGGSYPLKLPSEIDAEARREMAIEQERMAFITSTNLHLPPDVAEAARKAATYDSGALKKARELNDEVPPGSLRDAILRVDMAASEGSVTKTERDEGRRPARSGSSSTWGTPFSIEWIKVNRLPFSRTRHIRNSFNGNREIKVSRDDTEVEPAAGQALIDEFDRVLESPPEAQTSAPQP